MKHLIWFVIMIPCSSLFTAIGIFSWRRKKPMWFWSGTTVKSEKIKDIPAYNRANGWMWIFFSLIFWISTFLAIWSEYMAAFTVLIGVIIGFPILILVYGKIYNKYKK